MLKASKYEAGHKIRFLFRVVIDDDVDRTQVYAWRHVQPSVTNCPYSFLYRGSPLKKNKKKELVSCHSILL